MGGEIYPYKNSEVTKKRSWFKAILENAQTYFLDATMLEALSECLTLS